MSTSPITLLPIDEAQPRIESDSEFGPQAAEPPARWDDPRRFPRYPFQAPVEATIYPLAESSTQTAVQCSMLTKDVSRGGINLIHCEQLFPGQKIDIVLNGAKRSVEVVWCRRRTNRCYSAGCHFIKTDGATEEPREYPRYPYQASVEATIHPSPAGGDKLPVQRALVSLDVSRSGINLMHTDQLFTDQRIQILLEGLQRSLGVVVVWCRRLANRCYSAGCRFVFRKPPGGPI